MMGVKLSGQALSRGQDLQIVKEPCRKPERAYLVSVRKSRAFSARRISHAVRPLSVCAPALESAQNDGDIYRYKR